jgi:excisionase family DNA binding protein
MAIINQESTVMTQNTSSEGVLTLAEVAAYLKVTERTIYRLAGAKKVPAFKVGGVWRFSRAEIDNWIKQQSAEDPVRRNALNRAATGKKNDEEPKSCLD